MKLTAWPGPMLLLYLGRATPAEVMSAAKSADAETDLSQRCEANFYLGEKALLEGKRDEAQRYFREAVSRELKSSPEFVGAEVELGRF